MTYKEAQNYLNSFINFENKNIYAYNASFKLERMQEFLKAIGSPQEDLNCIHVAGSKGKGSACAFMAYILRAAGFKTGLYTSPHLWDFRERIRILRQKTEDRRQKADFEGMISRKELVALVEKLKPVIDKFSQESEYGPLSFFEVYTAIAFQYFKEEKVDLVVLETGLGGRLDATNTVNALVSCITPISLEHTQILGKTIAKIAGEKAGIIKNSRQLIVVSKQEKEALQVIRARCRKIRAELFEYGKDFSFQNSDIFGILRGYKNLKINLMGRHQLINAATAVAGVEALHFFGINIPAKAIKRGLRETRWPARFEIIKPKPQIILDGAHSPASACELRKTWKAKFNSHKPILVFGIAQDKDFAGVVRELSPISDEIILTKADNPRATEPQELKKFFPAKKNLMITEDSQEAMRLALQIARDNQPILVTGSLFVVAEVRKLCLN